MIATFFTLFGSVVSIQDDAGQDFEGLGPFAGHGVPLAGTRDDGVADARHDLGAVVVDPGLSGHDVEDLLLVLVDVPADGASGLEYQARIHPGRGAHFLSLFPDMFELDRAVSAPHGGPDFGGEG